MGDNEPMDDEETSREAEAWRQLEADIRRKNEEFELRRQELLRQQQQRKTVSLYKRGCAYRSIHVYMYTYLSIYPAPSCADRESMTHHQRNMGNCQRPLWCWKGPAAAAFAAAAIQYATEKQVCKWGVRER
jgi:hypothetical protein